MSLSVRAESLVIVYRDRLVCGPISFEIEKGACLWITGSNGCGKTGLLRVLAGLDAPYSGEVFVNTSKTLQNSQNFNSKDSNDMVFAPTLLSERRAACVYFSEPDGFQDKEKLTEVARFESAVYGAESLPTPSDWQRFGLAHLKSSKVEQLSQGQRRRLAIMLRLGLAAEKKSVWLLDEPENSLDKQALDLLNARITSFTKRNGSVIIAGHHVPKVSHKRVVLS